MKKGLYSFGGIIILLIAAFIFVLVPAFAGKAEGMNLPEYASYNGVPIKFEEGTEFYQLANNMVQQMEYQGYEFNQDYATFYYSLAFNQAFNQIIGSMALRDMTNSTGYIVPESITDRTLIIRHYSESGDFSQAMYNATPDDKKREYQEQVTKDLELVRAYEDLFGSEAVLGKNKLYGLKASSAEVEFIRKMGTDLHSFEYVTFNLRSYPTEKTEEFAKANKDKFTKYDYTVITVEDEAKAKDVLNRLNNSEITFEDALTTYSTNEISNPETGKLVQNRRHQIEKEVEEESLDKVLSLAKGAMSEPVKISIGWAIFRCDENAVQPDFSNEDELREVSNYIFANEKGMIEDYYMAIANDFIAAAATTSFDEACEKFEKTKGTIDSLALNYNNTTLVGQSKINDINEFNGATSNENFLKAAFSLKNGETSTPIVIPSTNNIAVLRCSNIEQGGTSEEDAPRLIRGEIANADSVSVNSAIKNSSKIKMNVDNFLFAFNGLR